MQAALAELLHQRLQAGNLLPANGFGDFQFHIFQRNAGIVTGNGQDRGQRRGREQRNPRKVDGDLHQIQPRRAPCFHLRHRLIEHKQIQIPDIAALFQRANKPVWRNDGAILVQPAHQRFCANKHARRSIHLRLEIHGEPSGTGGVRHAAETVAPQNKCIYICRGLRGIFAHGSLCLLHQALNLKIPASPRAAHAHFLGIAAKKRRAQARIAAHKGLAHDIGRQRQKRAIPRAEDPFLAEGIRERAHHILQ